VLVYALGRGGMPRWPLWTFVAVGAIGFAVMLPMSAAFIGTSMAAFQRLVIFQNWI
jgi:fructose-specific phosphotransferase system IIC component